MASGDRLTLKQLVVPEALSTAACVSLLKSIADFLVRSLYCIVESIAQTVWCSMVPVVMLLFEVDLMKCAVGCSYSPTPPTPSESSPITSIVND